MTASNSNTTAISRQPSCATFPSEIDAPDGPLPHLGHLGVGESIQVAQHQCETHLDVTRCVLAIGIRATNLGLKQIPVGFHLTVQIGDAGRQTAYSPVQVDQGIVEWNVTIQLPSDLTWKVRLSIYVTFESTTMPGHGDLLHTLEVSAGDLLDRCDESLPIVFQPQAGEIVSSCTSVLITARKILGDEDPVGLSHAVPTTSDETCTVFTMIEAGHTPLVRLQQDTATIIDSSTSKVIATRLCATCSTLTSSQIYVGKILFFDIPPSLGRRGCNLCELIHGVYTLVRGRIFRYAVNPPNIELHKTTPTHALRLEILSIEVASPNPGVWNEPAGHVCNPIVANTSITDTWYGNTVKQQLYFRDLQSSDECALARHAPVTTTWVDTTFQIHGVLSTWADLALARRWVRECVEEHRDCGATPPMAAAIVLHASTRFIDVHLKRLVQITDIIGAPVEYVALSYVWGGDHQTLTTSRNLEIFSRRLPIDTDPANRLPKTVRDAMLVTRALGYRFLWVDALCILQDSPADMAVQLPQMGRIYSLAVTTIVARGSTSSDYGIPGVSIPRNQILGANTEVLVNRSLGVGCWDVLTDASEEMDEREATSSQRKLYVWRGWTFQEQLMSTRTLEFNPKRMAFWCDRKRPQRETGYPLRPRWFDIRKFKYALRELQQMNPSPAPHTPKGGSSDRIAALWQSLRENYSARAFSYSTDRLNAILGTTNMLREISGDIDSDGHNHTHLHAELLWYVDPGCAARDPAPGGMFPSWSWLSMWPVSWPSCGKPVTGTTVRLAGNSTCRDDFSLVIEGPSLTLGLVDTPNSRRGQALARPDGAMTRIELRFDLPQAAGLIVECVPLAETNFGMIPEVGVLLLQFVGPHYVRLGIGSVPEYGGQLTERMNWGGAERKVMVCR
ncbi:HET-domain-containing protein [Leucogyrophana mollusca]|uniref:HET-domain-containing protein n=1 Tax=Leucogyrophana mollusca TaxID=85980 RepID=A0ACB8BQ70_9AGAM|nr:HET-domain-containing protein [Leucogyrophana mollusca]